MTTIAGTIGIGSATPGLFQAHQFVGFTFAAQAGQSVTLGLVSTDGDIHTLALYGPQTASGAWPPRLAFADDSDAADAHIDNLALPAAGTYLIVVGQENDGQGTFTLHLDAGTGMGCQPISCTSPTLRCGTIDDGCGHRLTCAPCTLANVTFNLHGYVVADQAFSFTTQDGVTNYAAACQSWNAEVGSLVQGTPGTVDCGTATNITISSNTSFFMPAATATLPITVATAGGVAPIERTTPVVSGAVLASNKDAFTSWRAACLAGMQAAAQSFGSTFIAAACDEPWNAVSTTTGNFQYSSSVRVWLQPTDTSLVPVTFAIDGYVIASDAFSFTSSDGTSNYARACDTFVAAAQNIANADAVAHDCGDMSRGTITISSNTSFFMPAGTATMQMTAALPRGAQPVIHRSDPVSGSVASDNKTAYESWRLACTAALANAKASLGDAFLAATCEEPYQSASGGNFQYTARVKAWVAPPAAQLAAVVFPVTGFIIDTQHFSFTSSDGATNLATACDDFTAHLTNLTVGDVVASNCGSETDVTISSNTSFFMPSATGSVMIRAFLPPGRQPVIRNGMAITGTVASDNKTAYQSWLDACHAGLDQVAQSFGASFVTAACTEPFNSASGGNFQFSSQIKVWLTQ
jgi:hypothetical protein